MEHRSHSISAIAGLAGALAYLSPIGWALSFLIQLFRKEDYIAFHLRQAGGIYVTLALLLFLSRIPYQIGFIIWLFGLLLCFFLWVVGFMGSVQNKRVIVPYFGPYYQSWFNITWILARLPFGRQFEEE